MAVLSRGIALGGISVPDAWRLLAPFAALHAAMFAYDVAHPDRFLRVDRWDTRLAAIQGLPAAAKDGQLAAYIAGHGIPGDWLPHALLYLTGGPYFIIFMQVILALASIVWVRDIAAALGLRHRHAGWAAALYALLPHTLVFPHQLASEAIFSPLVVLTFRLAIPALGGRAGLALAVATLVRPLTILWPFVQSAVQRASPRQRLAFAALALAPVLSWVGFIYVATGEASLGRSAHDLGSNLYFRMHRMAASLPAAEQPPLRPAGQTRATLSEYLAFVATHPVDAVAHSARDLTVFVFKSGIERLTLDYLDFFPERRAELQKAESGWRAQVERHGVLAGSLALLRAQPGLVISSALAAVFFTALVALAVVGAARWIREPATADLRRRRVLLMIFVVYVAATAQVVDRAQSRLRAPAEFALCVLAVAGWLALGRRKEKHRGF